MTLLGTDYSQKQSEKIFGLRLDFCERYLTTVLDCNYLKAY